MIGLPTAINQRAVVGLGRGAKFGDGSGYRVCATDGTDRPVEAGEESVTRGVDLLAAEARELLPDKRMVALHEVAPARIAELGELLRRADEVGESAVT